MISPAVEEPLSQGVEQSDDICSGLREVSECADDRHVPVVSGFAERYIKGGLYLACRGVFGKERQQGFTIGAYPDFCREDDVLGQDTGECDVRGSYFGFEQSAVLSHNVQLMESTQRIIPSRIRLQRFDDRSLALGKPLYTFQSAQRIERMKVGSKNWEVCFNIPRFAIACGKGGSKHIKTAADRVKISTGFNAKLEREKILLLSYNQMVASWRISIFKDYVNISVSPSAQPLFERWELGYGPIDGGLRAKEIVPHDCLPDRF